MRSPRRPIAVALVLAAAACGTKTTGDGLCSLLGPCGSDSGPPVTVSVVVGFPDSLVSTDPTNQIGIIPAGATVSLRNVRTTISAATGATAYETACATTDVVLDTLRWAVSDSSLATIGGGAGRATLRALSPGTFVVLTTTIPSGAIATDLWDPYIVACPSGRILNLIHVEQ